MSQKRNLAVKICKDRYIAFIDSDAYPSKDKIFNLIIKKIKNWNNYWSRFTISKSKGWSLLIG